MLTCECPLAGCGHTADIVSTWTAKAHAAWGVEPMLHAKVSCPAGHHFNMPFGVLKGAGEVTDTELYKWMYKVEDK